MKKSCVLTIDLGGTEIKTAFVNNSRIEKQYNISAENQKGLASALERIEKLLKDPASGYDIKAVGFGFPGLVDCDHNRIIGSNAKYPDAAELNLVEWASATWNADMYLDNDARLAAIGEWQYGAARGLNSIVTLTLGTGIGSGVIINGKILRGKHFRAGNLGGHLPLAVEEDILCTCGNRNCAEAFASTWSLQRKLREDPPRGRLRDHKPEETGFRELFAAAQQGDDEAKNLMQHSLAVWSTLTVAQIHAYDPEAVILTGNVMKSGDIILSEIQAYVDKYAWLPTHRVEIRNGQCPESAVLLGAAHLALHGRDLEII